MTGRQPFFNALLLISASVVLGLGGASASGTGGPAAMSDRTESDRGRAVEAWAQGLEDAYNTCDAAALEHHFSRNAAGFGPVGPFVSADPVAIGAFCDQGGVYDYYFDVIKADDRGEWAYVAGANRGSVRAPDGTISPLAGRFSVVLVKEEGAWRAQYYHLSPDLEPLD